MSLYFYNVLFKVIALFSVYMFCIEAVTCPYINYIYVVVSVTCVVLKKLKCKGTTVQIQSIISPKSTKRFDVAVFLSVPRKKNYVFLLHLAVILICHRQWATAGVTVFRNFSLTSDILVMITLSYRTTALILCLCWDTPITQTHLKTERWQVQCLAQGNNGKMHLSL